MDRDLIGQKLESLRRCVTRVRERCPASAERLAADLDAQDILALNLTRAVHLCVDLGAHLLSATELPPPTTMGQTFDLLARAELLPGAVGFRNLAVHDYDAIDWEIVFAIAQHQLGDFEAFARAVVAASTENE